ncbi:MAG: hypothetical protein ACFFFT_00295 [Candidatus Thorarchaeota archaeon]
MNELKKWNYAYTITRTFDYEKIIKELKSIDRGDHVKLVIKALSTPIIHQATILDFEGNPVFMVGLRVYDTLFSFYIEDYEYKNELYLLLMKILSRFEGLVFFTFSDHEKVEIKKIYQYLECQGIDLSTYLHIEQVPIINLQLGVFESLLEALYSINPEMKITGDALFRYNRLVDQLFYARKYEEIVVHNQNCLVNESIIFKKRWLKLYTV